jgi:phenylalanyl-tRNA synthetase alpha chain
MIQLQDIISSSIAKVDLASSVNELNQLKSELLGKKISINQTMQSLSMMNAEERKNFGQQINAVKQQITEYINNRLFYLEEKELKQRLEREKLDLTIIGRPRNVGSIHPISQVIEELTQVFARFGFIVKDGPNIETDWYNFTALNIADDHPARQMHDSFYLSGGEVLRTHTSPVQIRTMRNTKPPLRIIAPGRTYRSDSDMTHTPMFHQIEGLALDQKINMGHLKYVIMEFVRTFFEQANMKVRFRPSFFPFTEPSAEVDICMEGSDKWLEVLGCGMVHPKVLANVGIDANEYQGFAFGLGCERLAMLKYNIKDLRQCFEGDLRWLKHYNFSAFDIPSLVGGLTK